MPFVYHIQAEHGSLKASMTNIDYKYYIPADEPARPLILEPLRGDKGQPIYCSEKLTWHEENIKIEGSAFDVGTSRYYDMDIAACLRDASRRSSRGSQCSRLSCPSRLTSTIRCRYSFDSVDE